MTGRAAKGVARQLRAHAFHVIVEPESFLVNRQDRLDPQETDRARAWGAGLAARLAGQAAATRG